MMMVSVYELHFLTSSTYVFALCFFLFLPYDNTFDSPNITCYNMCMLFSLVLVISFISPHINGPMLWYLCMHIHWDRDRRSGSGGRVNSTIASFCHIGKVIENKYTNSNINRISTAIKCRSYSIVLQLLWPHHIASPLCGTLCCAFDLFFLFSFSVISPLVPFISGQWQRQHRRRKKVLMCAKVYRIKSEKLFLFGWMK